MCADEIFVRVEEELLWALDGIIRLSTVTLA
jgi:hypothetical protein